MTRPIGWDPDPLTIEEPDPAPRRFGCSVAVITLILALSGVPGVVAGPAPSDAVQPRVTLAAVSPLTVERHRGASVGPSGLMSGHPPGGAGADLASAVGETAGAPPTSQLGTVLLGGFATWYDTPGFTAAAGPALRDVLGDWRGRYVTVEAGDRSVVVRLTDWCACGERHGRSTLLDLSRKAFAALADPSLGVIRVSIEIDGSPRPDEADDRMRDEVRDVLPATDMEDVP